MGPVALRGSVDLVLPPDLFDVMAPEDPGSALAFYRALFAELLPRATESDRTVLAEGMLAWRARLLADGVLLHGLVAVPDAQAGGTAAHWHLMAGVVEVPDDPDLDTAALAARLLGDDALGPHVYTESFDTEMGWGLGVITQAPLASPEGPGGTDGGTPLPAALGLAAGLSAPIGGDRGLLVVGICLDTDRTLELASLVALVAGSSVIRLDEENGDR